MKELNRDKTSPLFLQIAQEYGLLKRAGHNPNRLLINKNLVKKIHPINIGSIFPELEVLITDESFDFSFEQVFEKYKFLNH